jgi:hypothetical protein
MLDAVQAIDIRPKRPSRLPLIDFRSSILEEVRRSTPLGITSLLASRRPTAGVSSVAGGVVR